MYSQQEPPKRSLEDYAPEPPPKRRRRLPEPDKTQLAEPLPASRFISSRVSRYISHWLDNVSDCLDPDSHTIPDPQGYSTLGISQKPARSPKTIAPTILKRPAYTTSRSYSSHGGSSEPAYSLASDMPYISSPGKQSRRRDGLDCWTYRDENLQACNIYFQPSLRRDDVPNHVALLADKIRKDRDSPEPSINELGMEDHRRVFAQQYPETDVKNFFDNRLFTTTYGDCSLKRNDKVFMERNSLPPSSSRMSTPVPNMLYGYPGSEAFSIAQRNQLSSLSHHFSANKFSLRLPFFVVELKGSNGFLWVAENQCLGGSATCVHLADQLNRQLRECVEEPVHCIDSSAFSIAMSGTEARLYISWKQDDLAFYMAHIESYSLFSPEHYLQLRKHVRNILDWGKGERLQAIHSSLDALLEAAEKGTAAEF